MTISSSSTSRQWAFFIMSPIFSLRLLVTISASMAVSTVATSEGFTARQPQLKQRFASS